MSLIAKNDEKLGFDKKKSARIDELPGIARFGIAALKVDRELIRALAKRLSDGGADARQIRATLKRIVERDPPKGGILAALRRSPLVGAALDLERRER